MALAFVSLSVIVMLAMLVWRVALYALPVMITITVYQWASAHGLTGGKSLLLALALAGMAVALVVLITAFARNPLLRLAAVLLFSVPAAIAGYTLVHGIAKHSLEEGIGLTLLCTFGGFVVCAASVAKLNSLGTSAWLSLTDNQRPEQHW